MLKVFTQSVSTSSRRLTCLSRTVTPLPLLTTCWSRISQPNDPGFPCPWFEHTWEWLEKFCGGQSPIPNNAKLAMHSDACYCQKQQARRLILPHPLKRQCQQSAQQSRLALRKTLPTNIWTWLGPLRKKD